MKKWKKLESAEVDVAEKLQALNDAIRAAKKSGIKVNLKIKKASQIKINLKF